MKNEIKRIRRRWKKEMKESPISRAGYRWNCETIGEFIKDLDILEASADAFIAECDRALTESDETHEHHFGRRDEPAMDTPATSRYR